MSANSNTKKQCVTCSKSGGVLICDGCQQIFCGKHVIEHRQELGVQLDGIMQKHDLLQQKLGRLSSNEHLLLRKINDWEKESIAKIQAAAEKARTNLQQLLEQSKERLSKTCHDVADNLRSSREADDYSEYDLGRWMKQLKDIKLEIKSSSTAKLVKDKNSTINLIKIRKINPTKIWSERRNKLPPIVSFFTADKQERFFQTLGPVTLEDQGSLAKHTGSTSDHACVRGRLLYSEKSCHMIRFKIEQCKQPYHIFFGFMSSLSVLRENVLRFPGAVGWFGFNQVYENGRCSNDRKKYGYNSHNRQDNDELYLMTDGAKRKIYLWHERTNTLNTLLVNHNLATFPWQFLLVLCNPGDSVRILPDD